MWLNKCDLQECIHIVYVLPQGRTEGPASIVEDQQLRDSAPSDKVDTEPVIMLEKMGVSDLESDKLSQCL
jgi:hypothetical protein